MNARNELRKTIRLNIDHGLLLFRMPGLAALSCGLHDLSATGCGARFDHNTLDPKLLQQWKSHFIVGARLDLELSRPPLFKSLKLQAEIAHVENDADNNPELGLRFLQTTSAQNAALERALQVTATDKIKHGGHDALLQVHADTLAPTAPAKPVEEHEWSHEKLAQKSLVEVLAMLRLLTTEQADSVESRAEVERLSLPRYLLKERLVKPDELCRGLALHSALPTVNLKDRKLPDELVHVYSYLTMLRYDVVPFARSKEILCVAAAAPLSVETINELSQGCEKEVLVFLAPMDQIHSQLFKLCPRKPFKERHHPRMKASIPVSIQYCDENGVNFDNDIHIGEAQDISGGGFKIEASPPSNLSAQYLLENRAQARLEFSWHEKSVHAQCLIRHIETRSQSEVSLPHWLVGLQIIDLPEHEVDVLHQISEQAIKDHRATSYYSESKLFE